MLPSIIQWGDIMRMNSMHATPNSCMSTYKNSIKQKSKNRIPTIHKHLLINKNTEGTLLSRANYPVSVTI